MFPEFYILSLEMLDVLFASLILAMVIDMSSCSMQDEDT